MIGGDLAAYFLGLLVEYEWGKQVSLLVFLALYFFSLWLAWMLTLEVSGLTVSSNPARCIWFRALASPAWSVSAPPTFSLNTLAQPPSSQRST